MWIDAVITKILKQSPPPQWLCFFRVAWTQPLISTCFPEIDQRMDAFCVLRWTSMPHWTKVAVFETRLVFYSGERLDRLVHVFMRLFWLEWTHHKHSTMRNYLGRPHESGSAWATLHTWECTTNTSQLCENCWCTFTHFDDSNKHVRSVHTLTNVSFVWLRLNRQCFNLKGFVKSG